MNNPQIGDRVQVGHGTGVRQGILRSVGECDYRDCKYGAECADVVLDDECTHRSYRLGDLLVIVDPADVAVGDHLCRTLRPGDVSSVLMFWVDRLGNPDASLLSCRTTDGSWVCLTEGVLTRAG